MTRARFSTTVEICIWALILSPVIVAAPFTRDAILLLAGLVSLTCLLVYVLFFSEVPVSESQRSAADLMVERRF